MPTIKNYYALQQILEAPIESLEKMANQTQTLESVTLYHLAKIRNSIHEKSLTREMLDPLIGLMYLPMNEWLTAEGYSVIGSAYEALKNHEDASRFYEKSYRSFQNCGSEQSSLYALLNSQRVQTFKPEDLSELDKELKSGRFATLLRHLDELCSGSLFGRPADRKHNA